MALTRPTHEVRCGICGRLLALITSGQGLVELHCRHCRKRLTVRLVASG